MVVGEFTQEAHLVVIGGGPGGYAAAFRAAELGVQTVLVDSRPALGGTCLHEGCVPSKILLGIGEVIDQAARGSPWGVNYGAPRLDPSAMSKWTGGTISKLAQGLDSLARKLGVDRIEGRARFEDSRHLAIQGGPIARLKFKRVIVATGARSILPAWAGDAGSRVRTAPQALSIETIPSSILVIGSDYMAVELASIYAALGSHVTVLSPDERLLPEADADLVRPLTRALKERSIDVRLAAAVESLRESKSRVGIRCANVEPGLIEADQAVVCAGQSPCVDELNLAATQVTLDERRFIRVDDRQATSDQRVLAVGDVTGAPMLAHRALHQGRVAAEVVAGRDAVFDARAIPMVVFTNPDVAWCGLTESEAAARGVPHAVSRVPWGSSGRAVGLGKADGLTKIIFDPQTRLVLGVGMVGHGAAEMIAEGCFAVEMGAVVDDLCATIHPHPTISELLGEAALASRATVGALRRPK
jgi:dihydrolipoamide dehydrogenase